MRGTAARSRFDRSSSSTRDDHRVTDKVDHAELAELIRIEGRRVLATLVRITGNLGLAEDAVQDASERALVVWPREGTPRNPGAWLTTTARHKALDRLRRENTRLGREQQAMWLQTTPTPSVATLEELFPESALRDDQLRLLFTVCHPALSPEARVALALRTIGGLNTTEIARALRISEATVAQRVVRAKRKISDAAIPYRVPDDHELPERLRSVLNTIYSIFTAGHHAAEGPLDGRFDVAAEGQRLAGELASLMPDEPECIGLYALTLATHARCRARVDLTGGPVLMRDQDRALWNRDAIARADALLQRSLSPDRLGPFQLQAAIACLHGLAPTWAETDWAEITELYARLFDLQPTPVVRVNWAIAAAESFGPEAGLQLLDQIDHAAVATWHLAWAARADLEQRSGDLIAARDAFSRALACDMNDHDRVVLSRRLAALENN
jgi:RNA polymerase sigma-70 factor, ECF subfamily